MSALQLDLFRMDAGSGEQVEVKVYATGDRGYRATIADGWWTAYGTTREKAATACFASYQAERDAYTCGLGAQG